MSNNNMNINNMSITVTDKEYDSFIDVDLDIDFENIIETSSINTLRRQYRKMYLTFHGFTKVYCDKGEYAAVSVEGSGNSKWYWYHALDDRYLFVINGTCGWSYFEGMPREDEIVDFEKYNIIKTYIDRDEQFSIKYENFLDDHLISSIKKLERYFKIDNMMLCKLNDAAKMLDNKAFYEMLDEEHLVILGH